jgi:hypothetical protein
MWTVYGLCMIFLLVGAGCEVGKGQHKIGTYQLGASVNDPQYEELSLIPVLDTRTGEIYVIKVSGFRNPEEWDAMRVDPIIKSRVGRSSE